MYIKVRVKTGQKKESVVRVSRLQANQQISWLGLPTTDRSAKTSFNVSVKERPERNAANTRIIRLIAAELGVAVKKVRIMSGHHAPSKTLSILE